MVWGGFGFSRSLPCLAYFRSVRVRWHWVSVPRVLVFNHIRRYLTFSHGPLTLSLWDHERAGRVEAAGFLRLKSTRLDDELIHLSR